MTDTDANQYEFQRFIVPSPFSSSEAPSSSSSDEEMNSTEPPTEESSSSSLSFSDSYESDSSSEASSSSSSSFSDSSYEYSSESDSSSLSSSEESSSSSSGDEYRTRLNTLPCDVIRHITFVGLDNDEDRTCLRLVSRVMPDIIRVLDRTLKIQSVRGRLSADVELPKIPFLHVSEYALPAHVGPFPYTSAERDAMDVRIPTLLPRFKRGCFVVNQVRRYAGTTEDIGLDVTLSDFVDILNHGDFQLYLLQNKLRETGYSSDHMSRNYLERRYKRLVEALIPGARPYTNFNNIKDFVDKSLAVWDGYRAYVTKVVEFLVTLENMAGILNKRIGFIHPDVVESEWMKYKVYLNNFVADAATILRDSSLGSDDDLLAKIVAKTYPYPELPGSPAFLEAPQPAGNDATLKRVGDPLENDNPSKRQKLEDSDLDDASESDDNVCA